MTPAAIAAAPEIRSGAVPRWLVPGAGKVFVEWGQRGYAADVIRLIFGADGVLIGARVSAERAGRGRAVLAWRLSPLDVPA